MNDRTDAFSYIGTKNEEVKILNEKLFFFLFEIASLKRSIEQKQKNNIIYIHSVIT